LFFRQLESLRLDPVDCGPDRDAPGRTRLFDPAADRARSRFALYRTVQRRCCSCGKFDTSFKSTLARERENAWSTTMSRRRQQCRLCGGFALLIACLIVVSATVGSSTAHAAVSYCMPLMQADPAEGSSVTIAKRLALANWLRRAATFGVEYTRWGISWNHELVCRATGRGTVVCQAAGHPCAVRQVPPDSFIPLRPGVLQTAINPEGLARVGAR
jgi:hypothetical protein